VRRGNDKGTEKTTQTKRNTADKSQEQKTTTKHKISRDARYNNEAKAETCTQTKRTTQQTQKQKPHIQKKVFPNSWFIS
jgi:hypothetical protein